MSRFKNFWALYRPEIILIPPLFLLDRLSKILALDFLAQRGSLHIAPFFRLTFVRNTGAAFGSFQGGNYILAGVSAVILFLLFKWRGELIKTGRAARYAFIFIVAGALGNVYDRIILGYVVDYFDFIIWPVFNIADSFITVGAILLGYTLVFSGKGEQK